MVENPIIKNGITKLPKRSSIKIAPKIDNITKTKHSAVPIEITAKYLICISLDII